MSAAKTKHSNGFVDLTVRPPRSPRVRLGGFVILARVLDKGRATLRGKNGEYNYNCPLDQHFLRYVGIDADGLLKQLSLDKGDGEILQWISANSTTKPHAWQISAWSAYHEQRGPTDLESRVFFNKYHKSVGPRREDISGWFDVLDLDDFVSFGGKP
ncbi:MAG: DUF5069 domain-containing protein [Verrucomicrobia bacterium]|nr:DUF5069 domain-containing protein [Verrucomicrobiota bacterium]MBI3867183.1 DUF5069 domain-containing protein [Verrucomicrobiota bacterium]